MQVAVSELVGEFPDRTVKSISADISKSSVKTVLEKVSKGREQSRTQTQRRKHYITYKNAYVRLGLGT